MCCVLCAVAGIAVWDVRFAGTQRKLTAGAHFAERDDRNLRLGHVEAATIRINTAKLTDISVWGTRSSPQTLIFATAP